MKQENKSVPESVQASDEELKKLGAREKDGKLVVKGEAEDVVWGQNKKVDELRARIPQDVKRLTNITGREEFTEKRSESLERDPRLAAFHIHYDRWGAINKERCSWEEVQRRLLKDNGHYLELASEMEHGGVLFGVDSQGTPLVADGGEEPIMKDMNYRDTRTAVMFKELEGKQVETGYEMFPYLGDHDKSSEIEAFEAYTGNPFISSLKSNEWKLSWLESGENPSSPKDISFDTHLGYARVGDGQPNDLLPWRGVRRLLRVKA